MIKKMKPSSGKFKKTHKGIVFTAHTHYKTPFPKSWIVGSKVIKPLEYSKQPTKWTHSGYLFPIGEIEIK